MEEINLCFECGKALSIKAKACRCGWARVNQDRIDGADHRCRYSIAGRRCPLPATNCAFAYAKGPWYCLGHYQVKGDLQLGEVVLRDAEENYRKILDARRDWRDRLI